jgi:hypothetical protein
MFLHYNIAIIELFNFMEDACVYNISLRMQWNESEDISQAFHVQLL